MEEEVVEIKDPKAVLAALERAKEDAKKFREQYESLVEETNALKEQVEAAKAERRDIAVRRAVSEAGADADRVMQFLKLDGISYEDGKLVGFDDEFSKLKTALPELFDPKRRVGGRVELETDSKANASKTVTEMQVERLLGHSGRR